MRRLLSILAFGAVAAAGTEAATTVAMLPLENLSGIDGAREELAAPLAAALEAKGYAVVRGDAVEEILEAERIRHLDSLTPAARQMLCRRLGAQGLVLGSVDVFLEGAVPVVALQARLVGEDGGITWADAAGRTGDDTEGLFELGRLTGLPALAADVVRNLVRDLPAAGANAPAARLPGAPRGRSPATFRDGALRAGGRYRICPLPLENRTDARPSARVVAPLLARRLRQSGLFDVVEPADLRAAMVAESVQSLRDAEPAALQKLGARIGTSLFLRGTIYSYREASPHGADVPPAFALELSLVDVASARILWTSESARQGRDYEGLLGRGAITNVVALADRTVAEMVHALLEARPGRTRAASAEEKRR
jgi:hypothetical protein